MAKARLVEQVSRLCDEGVREQGTSLITRRVSDIETKPINWLWPGRIARGKVSIIAGNPGIGKSQITASIASTVTTGGRWPADLTYAPIGDVVFVSAEDDPADTIRPRLEAAGADLTKVHILSNAVLGYTGSGDPRTRTFSLQADLSALSNKLLEIGNVAVVFIDPLTAYLGDVDSHRNADIRALLAPLADLALANGVAVIGVTHLNKSSGSEALMRVTGSLAFVAAARAAYLVTSDPETSSRRLFLPMKNNIGIDDSGLAFRIESAEIPTAHGPIPTSRILWESTPVTVTANEAMRVQEPKSDSALYEAAQWLRESLQEPMTANDVLRSSAEAGIAEKTLRRASNRIGVIKGKMEMKGGWWWSLPSKIAKKSEDAQE